MGCTYSGNNQAFLPHLQELPPDFASCLTHVLLQVSSNTTWMSGKKIKGWEKSLCTPKLQVPGLLGGGSGQESPRRGSPHPFMCCTGKELQECLDRVDCACSQPDVPKTVFGDICLNSHWRYRSAMSWSPRICCSLTYVCLVLLMQILEERC